jgi:hypothetical protein
MQTRPFDLYLILDLGLDGGANYVRTAFVGHGSCEIIASRVRQKQHTAVARPL